MVNLVKPAPQAANVLTSFRLFPFQGLSPIRRWLNGLEIRNAAFARLICRTIPTECPFERDISLFGRFAVHIPPLCKLNPLYEEVVGLRFRALCHLADECNEDIGRYC